MLETIQNILASLALSFDLPILDWIQANLRSPLMDKVMPIITLFGDAGIFWIAIALFLLIFPKTRKTGWSMGAALMLGLIVCNIVMKPTIARIRPYDLQAQLGNIIVPLGGIQKDFSFPSGHTIASFEACTVLLIKNKWMGIPATVLAFLIAFSRLYLYVHYPTDVIFSFFAGILFAFLGVLIVNIIYHFLPKGRFERLPN